MPARGRKKSPWVIMYRRRAVANEELYPWLEWYRYATKTRRDECLEVLRTSGSCRHHEYKAWNDERRMKKKGKK